MKFCFHVVILILAFNVDISLKAEAVFVPKNCWGVETPCAVENLSAKPMVLQLKGMKIHLDKEAVVKATSANEATLARGTLFAKHEENFRWHTPFGDILCKACEVLLQRDDKSIEIHALRGNVSVLRKGDDNQYDLPVGYSVLLSAIDVDGRANLDIPQASALRPVAKTWAKVYQGKPEEFRNDFKEYVATWKIAVETSSTMERKEVDRQIASAETDKIRKERAKLARQREDEKLRRLFREKNDL
jgi:hypothetical protein